MSQLESKFQKKVLADLKTVERCHFWKHQAGSIKGIPDIVGVINGSFFALELKKDATSTKKLKGRQVLQGWVLKKIREAGGYAEFTYPEIWDDTLADLRNWSRIVRNL